LPVKRYSFLIFAMFREETRQKKTAFSSNQISWFLFVKFDSETILKTELAGNKAGCSDEKV